MGNPKRLVDSLILKLILELEVQNPGHKSSEIYIWKISLASKPLGTPASPARKKSRLHQDGNCQAHRTTSQSGREEDSSRLVPVKLPLQQILPHQNPKAVNTQRSAKLHRTSKLGSQIKPARLPRPSLQSIIHYIYSSHSRSRLPSIPI